MARRNARIEVEIEDLAKAGCMRVTQGVVDGIADHAREAVTQYLHENDLTASRVEVETVYGYEISRARTTARRRTG